MQMVIEIIVQIAKNETKFNLKVKTMTNFERIKQMSKVELASFLMRTKFSKDSNNDCIFSSKMCNKREIPNNCILCMNTWLKKQCNRDDINEMA